MNRALLVIDAQESFRQRLDWSAVNHPDISERISGLVAAVRTAGDEVIWVLHSQPGSDSVFDPKNGHVRLLSGLTSREEEVVLTKTVHNAFTTTDLEYRLNRAGVREVVICGIRTEQCCETTARVASDLGFGVVFVSDATATMPLADPRADPNRPYEQVLRDPRTFSPAQVVAHTEYALGGRFATLRSLAEMTGNASSSRMS